MSLPRAEKPIKVLPRRSLRRNYRNDLQTIGALPASLVPYVHQCYLGEELGEFPISPIAQTWPRSMFPSLR